jgi:CRP-like cAMP-binding protein
MFSQTPDDVLADVADLLVEVDANPGDCLIVQGEQGDSLFVIVDGKVRVHDHERLLSYLGERQVFGEMAADPEPRMASVTVESCLFRFDQALTSW